MSFTGLILLAWALELAIGWPRWLYDRIKHPVVWLGGFINALDALLNQSRWSHATRYANGMLAVITVIALTTGIAISVSRLLSTASWGFALEALIASSLIASRSLYSHVAAVLAPLAAGDLRQSRHAVSMIVGRDPDQLDDAAIARASLESLAENTSDGVIAPVFWGAIFGLPGIAAYKAINTLDSMIGHKNETYYAFGGFAARLDDLANWVPARMTGCLFVFASLKPSAFTLMVTDARHHRSPNAGWPEAAMAGALGVRLSGPRIYGDQINEERWLNETAPDPTINDLKRGLLLYRWTLGVTFIGLALLAGARMS